MDSESHRSHNGAGPLWSGAFLLFLFLVSGLAVFLLWREQNMRALWIALSVAIPLLGWAWAGTVDKIVTPMKVTSRRQLWWCRTLVAGGTFAVYFPTLYIYFLADDFGYVRLDSNPSLSQFLTLFSMDQTQGIWGSGYQELRPLGGLSYMVDYLLWGTNPTGYHLTAVMLHVASSLAVFEIARRATGAGIWGAVFAGLAFAFLPIHSESVAWINGSKVDALPSMFYVVGFLGFVSYRATGLPRYVVLSTLGFFGSLASKEIAVTFPVMVLAYDVFRWASEDREKAPRGRGRTREQWLPLLLPYVPIAGLLAAYLVLRGAIFRSVLRNEQWVFDIREATASLAGLRSQLGRLWTAFASLQTYNAGEFLFRFSRVTVGIALGLFLVWTVFLLRRREGERNALVWVLYFGGVWYLIACLPLLITYHSSRHLYLPVAGPCIALACLAVPRGIGYSRRVQGARIAGALALLGILAILVMRQNAHWVRAGEISAKLEREFIAALRAIPEEALVVATAPYNDNQSYVWAWVMPYALQEPFVSGDLYSVRRLVESPDLFCCPVDQWWEGKRRMLVATLSGDPDEEVEVYRLTWNRGNQRVEVMRRVLLRRSLRTLVEAVLRGPVETTKDVPAGVASELMGALRDLTAQEQ